MEVGDFNRRKDLGWIIDLGCGLLHLHRAISAIAELYVTFTLEEGILLCHLFSLPFHLLIFSQRCLANASLRYCLIVNVINDAFQNASCL